MHPCQLTTVGRKTGLTREIELNCVEDGPNVAVVASNDGQDHEPAWWLNLRANPGATVRIGEAVRAVRARQATPSEQARIWARFVAGKPEYAEYQGRTSRHIAVVILEPGPDR